MNNSASLTAAHAHQLNQHPAPRKSSKPSSIQQGVCVNVWLLSLVIIDNILTKFVRIDFIYEMFSLKYLSYLHVSEHTATSPEIDRCTMQENRTLNSPCRRIEHRTQLAGDKPNSPSRRIEHGTHHAGEQNTELTKQENQSAHPAGSTKNTPSRRIEQHTRQGVYRTHRAGE